MKITENHLRVINIIFGLSIDQASRALSKTLKVGARIEMEKTTLTEISKITEQMNDDPQEMSGSIVNFDGEVALKLLFLIPLEHALKLTDLFLRQPVGTTTEFNEYTEGVVQEIGNVLASCISNVLSSDSGSKSLPSAPIVMSDFGGTIFSMFIMEEAMLTDDLLLIETRFELQKIHLECYLFLLPHPDSLETMVEKCGAIK